MDFFISLEGGKTGEKSPSENPGSQVKGSSNR